MKIKQNICSYIYIVNWKPMKENYLLQQIIPSNTKASLFIQTETTNCFSYFGSPLINLQYICLQKYGLCIFLLTTTLKIIQMHINLTTIGVFA